MKDLFISFLKEQGAEDNYNKMAQKRIDDSISFKVIDDFLNSTSPRSFISAVYQWSLTEQGHSYWGKINRNWLKELKKTNK